MTYVAYEQLDDKETYQLLSNDPTQESVKRFHQYLDLCLRDRVISKVEHDKLTAPHSIETQTMYVLLKIHKDPIKLKPILSCTNGPTYTSSGYVDRLLQPHMKWFNPI